jgi:hypothetical protein
VDQVVQLGQELALVDEVSGVLVVVDILLDLQVVDLCLVVAGDHVGHNNRLAGDRSAADDGFEEVDRREGGIVPLWDHRAEDTVLEGDMLELVDQVYILCHRNRHHSEGLRNLLDHEDIRPVDLVDREVDHMNLHEIRLVLHTFGMAADEPYRRQLRQRSNENPLRNENRTSSLCEAVLRHTQPHCFVTQEYYTAVGGR